MDIPWITCLFKLPVDTQDYWGFLGLTAYYQDVSLCLLCLLYLEAAEYKGNVLIPFYNVIQFKFSELCFTIRCDLVCRPARCHLTLKVLLRDPLCRPSSPPISNLRVKRPAPFQLTAFRLANRLRVWAQRHQQEPTPSSLHAFRNDWRVIPPINSEVRGPSSNHNASCEKKADLSVTHVFFFGAGFYFRLHRPLEITTWVAIVSCVFYITRAFYGNTWTYWLFFSAAAVW